MQLVVVDVGVVTGPCLLSLWLSVGPGRPLLSGVELDRRVCVSLSAVQIQGVHVLLDQLSPEVFRHKVGWVRCALHLDGLHCSAESLLLKPEGAYVQVTYAADPPAL